MTGSNRFRAIAALGYATLLPIVPPDAPLHPDSTLSRRLARGKDARGKAPGVLRGDKWTGADWPKLATADGRVLDEWAAWQAGVGLMLGQGLAAMDIDISEAALCARISTLFSSHFPHDHKPRIGRAPKFLVLLHVDVGFAYRCVEFPDGQRVEFLCVGRQVVVDGLHASTRRPYTWPQGMPRREDLLHVDEARLDAFFAALAAMPEARSAVLRERSGAAGDRASVPQEMLRGRVESVRAAVKALPNTTTLFPLRSDYVRVGIAIKAALPDQPDDALEIYEDWCARWHDAPAAAGEPQPEDDLKRMHGPFAIGAGWLFAMAAKHGGWQRDPEEFFGPLAETPATLFDMVPATTEAASGVVALPIVTFRQAAAEALTVANRPLVKGLLDTGALSVWYGPSGQGKTFTVMDVALHVALGSPWNGRKVRQGRVIYIAAEGAVGARKRAAAMSLVFGLDTQDVALDFVLVPVDLLHTEAPIGKASLLAAIAERPDTLLVVVDTASRAMAGGDENASTDMGALVRNVDAIRSVTGAHVLLVHHTGKDIARGARGHSLLRAATDTEVEINENELVVTKQREIETSLSMRFALDVTRLGTDEDGDPLTSCVVRWNAEEKPMSVAETLERLTPRESEVLRVVQLLAETGEGGRRQADLLDIVESMRAAGHAMSHDNARKVLRRLAEKKLLATNFRGKWEPNYQKSEGIIKKDVFE